jgi:hypothetical protein
MNVHLTYVLTAAACLVALACGHEAAAPSGLQATPAPVVVPVATALTPPVVTVTTVAANTTSARDACIEVDSDLGGKHVTLDGRVFVDNAFEHPSRGKTHPYILRLDTPRCANGAEESTVSELHLAATDDVDLKPLVGKRVRVSGDPFVAHTAWHARPIVLMTTTASRRYD